MDAFEWTAREALKRHNEEELTRKKASRRLGSLLSTTSTNISQADLSARGQARPKEGKVRMLLGLAVDQV